MCVFVCLWGISQPRSPKKQPLITYIDWTKPFQVTISLISFWPLTIFSTAHDVFFQNIQSKPTLLVLFRRTRVVLNNCSVEVIRSFWRESWCWRHFPWRVRHFPSPNVGSHSPNFDNLSQSIPHWYHSLDPPSLRTLKHGVSPQIFRYHDIVSGYFEGPGMFFMVKSNISGYRIEKWGISRIPPWQNGHLHHPPSITHDHPITRNMCRHMINGHFRNLNWRYLPYIRPI